MVYNAEQETFSYCGYKFRCDLDTYNELYMEALALPEYKEWYIADGVLKTFVGVSYDPHLVEKFVERERAAYMALVIKAVSIIKSRLKEVDT